MKQTANEHDELIHERDATKYKCELCGFQKYSKRTLNLHSKKPH